MYFQAITLHITTPSIESDLIKKSFCWILFVMYCNFTVLRNESFTALRIFQYLPRPQLTSSHHKKLSTICSITKSKHNFSVNMPKLEVEFHSGTRPIKYKTETRMVGNNSRMNVQIEFPMASYHADIINISHKCLFSICVFDLWSLFYKLYCYAYVADLSTLFCPFPWSDLPWTAPNFRELFRKPEVGRKLYWN